MPEKLEKDDDSFEDLGALQREVVQVVWANAPVTAEAVRERLSRPLKESTVRTVLRRLEEKGYVSHALEGRAFMYRAAEPRRKVAASAVKRIIDWFCNGSTEELLLGMVDHAMLDRRQLQELAEKVKNAKSRKTTIEKATRTTARTSKRTTRGMS
jgi:BlaI family penicillinase repressor